MLGFLRALARLASTISIRPLTCRCCCSKSGGGRGLAPHSAGPDNGYWLHHWPQLIRLEFRCVTGALPPPSKPRVMNAPWELIQAGFFVRHSINNLFSPLRHFSCGAFPRPKRLSALPSPGRTKTPLSSDLPTCEHKLACRAKTNGCILSYKKSLRLKNNDWVFEMGSASGATVLLWA